jgi:hypothetical protein
MGGVLAKPTPADGPMITSIPTTKPLVPTAMSRAMRRPHRARLIGSKREVPTPRTRWYRNWEAPSSKLVIRRIQMNPTTVPRRPIAKIRNCGWMPSGARNIALYSTRLRYAARQARRQLSRAPVLVASGTV